jgi:UDP-N-acetyl-D-galactosamine dehydrogenase
VVDIIAELGSYGMQVDVHDPWVDPVEAEQEYGVSPIADPAADSYHALVLAVSHDQFRELGITGLRRLGKPGAVVYDVKYLFPAEDTDGRL